MARAYPVNSPRFLWQLFLLRLRWLHDCRQLGFARWARLKFWELFHAPLRLFGVKSVKFTPPGSTHPITCRTGTSDIFTYWEIFAQRAYQCLDGVPKPALIVDCGANIGCSAAMFLAKFPDAILVAVEPDAANFAQLQANTRPFAKRVKLHRAGVWSTACDLVVDNQGASSNSLTVRPAKPGEGAVIGAIDIETILRESGAERIGILKIDIEGAETTVFTENYQSWLDRVDHLVVELHSEEAELAFHRAVDQHHWIKSDHGYLAYARRRT